jgi:hypothetical protein
MREDTVAATTDTTYSTMIVDLVNDAKTLVENAYDWTALRAKTTVTTVASTTNYSLTDSGTRFKLIDVINDTDNFMMTQYSQAHLDQLQTISDTPEGSPYFFIFRDVDANGDLTVDFYPTPDGVYSVDFNAVKAQATLVASTNDATKILVPAEPVLHLALAMAVRERGETGGTSAQEHFNIADGFLSDAIALDAGRRPHEMTWYPE